MENTNKYWKGLEELNNDPKFLERKKNEFAEGIPLEEVLTESDGELTSNRRDFLKYFGFSVSAVALAACNKTPVKNAIPYIIKPETITPGIPNWYASTNPVTGVSVLVKTREGRPIKIEGNSQSPLFKGGVAATDHATILELYDNERLQGPKAEGNDVDWNTLDSPCACSFNNCKRICRPFRQRTCNLYCCNFFLCLAISWTTHKERRSDQHDGPCDVLVLHKVTFDRGVLDCCNPLD